MYSPDLTWGDARRFHKHMETMGMRSPDDLLADPKYQELSADQPDEALVFPPEDEVTYWYTQEDTEDGRLLELLMTDEVEGVISYREAGGWVDVNPNEESPTVYGPTMHQIKSEALEEALAFWDDKENADDYLHLEDVESHLA